MTGNELKQKREELGYTQVALAIALGYSPSSIARLEQLKDEEIPNSRTLDLAIRGLIDESKDSKSKK